LHALFADWEVVRWLSGPSWPQSFEQTQAFLQSIIDGTAEVPERYLVIELEGRPVGGISVRDRPASHLQRGDGPSIGYWLGRPFWGRRLMTETVAGLAHRIFGSGAAGAIYSGAFEGNDASLRVQEKVGFVRDGSTLLVSNPRGGSFPHINTVLEQARFEGARATIEVDSL